MTVDTIAWVVAIEKYAGPELDVKSAVGEWALEMAEVLLKRGATRIVLTTSLGDNPAYAPRLAALKQAGVTSTDARQGDIQNALDQLRGRGALLIYWVGHGIMAPERQLLCADSRKASDLRVLSADSLLRHLRAPDYPRLQIGFFECCAQIVGGSPAVLDLGGDGKAATRQFFYYAASATEFAAADTTRPGFSSTAIAALRDSVEFPPQSTAFFNGLVAAMRALPLATRPFLLQWTDESGDEWSREGAADLEGIADDAKIAELTPSQFDRLWREARKADIAATDLARAIRDNGLPALILDLRAKRPDLPAPDLLERAHRQLALERRFEPLCLHLRLFWQEWLALFDRLVTEDFLGKPEGVVDLPGLLLRALDQDRAENGRRSFVKLLELAARRAASQNPAAATELATALANDAELGPVHQAVVAEMPGEDNRLYLLLGVDWDPNAGAPSLVKACLYINSGTNFETLNIPPEGKLAERVNEIVQKVLEDYPGYLILELLAPNELLSTPRELLEVVYPDLGISTWLEAEHAITLRWHDRMRGKYNRGTWIQIARAARARAGAAASLLSWWPPETRGAAESHVVGLSIPGPCPAEPRRNSQAFFTELLKGMPYMCWPRNTPDNPEDFRKAAVELLAGSPLNDLPDSLRKLRNDPVLRDLILLIDEPDRNPYLTTYTETAQRGTT